jgi:hypothetical protein
VRHVRAGVAWPSDCEVGYNGPLGTLQFRRSTSLHAKATSSSVVSGMRGTSLTANVQHPPRFNEEVLVGGIRIVALTLERAVGWADELALGEGRRLKVPADQLSDATAQQCFALLTAERALIEFVTGPETRSKNGVPTKLYSDDICPKCFVTDWHLGGHHLDHLRGRRARINKHLSHLTWSQTVPRQWHTTPITLVVEAFADFNESLGQEQPRVSSVLTAALDAVNPAVERLRQAQTPQILEHALSAEAPSGASM